MKTIIAAFILGIAPLLASPSSSCPNLCPRSVGAEWIYFSPNSESPYYAELTSVNGSTSRIELENNKLDRCYSGFRVFGRFGGCGTSGLYGRFGNLVAKRSSSIIAPLSGSITNLLAAAPTSPIGPFFSAQARTTLEYWEADGLFEICLCARSCFRAAIAIGIHYGWIHSHNLFSFVADSGALLQRVQSDFWGIGPEIGFNASLPFWHCFALFGGCTGAAVIGEPREKVLSTVTAGTTTNFSLTPRGESWRTTIYFDVRLGVSATFALPTCWLGALRFKLEAGYEALAYLNALKELAPSNNSIPFATGQLYFFVRNFTLHGPFISGTLCF